MKSVPKGEYMSATSAGVRQNTSSSPTYGISRNAKVVPDYKVVGDKNWYAKLITIKYTIETIEKQFYLAEINPCYC